MVGLSEDDWGTLLERIAEGRCTPFLGAGASYPQMPLGGEVAREWAGSCDYPFQDPADLPNVAQYLAIKERDPLGPKRKIKAEFTNRPPPDFRVHGQPHGVLAALPLPVYLTTNYDDFMAQSLRAVGPPPRDPLVKVAPWTDSTFIPDEMKPGKRDGKPTPEHPLVFHLHGHISVVDSMVLTEDDYVDFLVRLGQHRDQLLPPFVQGAFTDNSLLFLGYRLSDWNFRVIHRALLGSRPHSQDPLHVTVQMEPDSNDVSEYLSRYYGRMDLQVYWGSAEKFCGELQDRWEGR